MDPVIMQTAFYHKFFESYKLLNMMIPNKMLNKVKLF